MKKELVIEEEQEVLSLITDVTYSSVSDWYNAIFTDLKMNLIIPKHRKMHKEMPMILWICGGAFSVVSNSTWMPELMYFARKGFVVASVEYRTSNQACFPAGLIDIKSAIRFLKAHANQFCINPDKIVVMGESAGGTYASLVGVTSNVREWEQGDYLSEDSRVAAIVDFYGLTDFEHLSYGKNETVPSWCSTAFLGEETYDENAKLASAVNYVSKDSVPFLILHGTQDALVPIAHSDKLYEKLCENNVYVEYYQIKNAGHGEDYFYQDAVKDVILSFINKIIDN